MNGSDAGGEAPTPVLSWSDSMSMNAMPGEEIPGQTVASSEEKESAGLADAVETDLDLAELIEFHESIDWSCVPTTTNAEAAAWTERLNEAHEEVMKEIEGRDR